MVRRRDVAAVATSLLAWLLALVMLAGFAPIPQETSSSVAVATIVIRAGEPSDVGPASGGESALDQHCRAADPRAARRASSLGETRSSPAWLGAEAIALLARTADPCRPRAGTRSAVGLAGRRTHLRMMVFLN